MHFANNTKKLDSYFQDNLYDDYNRTTFIPNEGIGYNYGVMFVNKFAIELDLGISVGVSFTDLSKAKNQQSKLMMSLTAALMFEYFWFSTDNVHFSIKTGYGVDNTSFLYNRKGIDNLGKVTLTSYPLVWTNSYIPIGLGTATYNKAKTRGVGYFIQYNIKVTKGSTKYRGLDVVESDMPNVSQNSLVLGVNYRW